MFQCSQLLLIFDIGLARGEKSLLVMGERLLFANMTRGITDGGRKVLAELLYRSRGDWIPHWVSSLFSFSIRLFLRWSTGF